MGESRTLIHPLRGAQADAVEPRDSVWLSASAGTGKTQVLSARVLRLLLEPGVEPSQILCLTFTKAGAAEMATRVNDVLASWVRMDDTALAQDLRHIGAPSDPDTRARARTRFANVLDTPGGGLRIDTIHAFSQWLLAAFPEEAELTPGTRPMEDRDRDLLAHEVLATMLVDAGEASRNNGEGPAASDAMLNALATLSVRMGPDGVRGWLMRCADAREMWFGPGSWQAQDIARRTRTTLGLASDASIEDGHAMCEDAAFPVEALRSFAAAMREWGTASGASHAERIEAWLASEPAARFETRDVLLDTVLKKDGTPRSFKKPLQTQPALADWQDAVADAYASLSQFAILLELSGWMAQALEIGRAFAFRWDAAKEREGFIDFDDQIRRAAALLGKSALSEWIRYKLDRRFDHILIDEAQDTNAAQWDIIRALTDDFFSGEGQREGVRRTIFVVGDYKQAIFRFQGTSPQNFAIARAYYEKLIGDAARGAAEARRRGGQRPLQELPLERSYRTAQPVLDFVDKAIAAIGPEQFGLDGAPGRHDGDDRPGEVVLWRPVGSPRGEEGGEQDDAPPENDSGDEEGWVSEPERRMADRIAAQVRDWIGSYRLHKGRQRLAGPGDIMVLVRKRKELAGLIVARLHAQGVPVAGVDRLRLAAPLAVRDLMAALRFAAQPRDDLSLAALLVSPLLGWTQQDLLEHGYRDRDTTLWRALRDSSAPMVRDTVARLGDLLRLADFEPPQALLHWVLVGPWGGRARLLGRLGPEMADPIDELLNAAHSYAAAHTASLAGFIHWFDSGDGELKRETGAADDLVRVMTVHGSKGLQAPIVVLADATGNPDASPVRSLTLPEAGRDTNGAREVPLPALRGHERVGPIAAAQDAAAKAEREEHWRLLYVAMTRAEEALFVGGALGRREDEPSPDSWYARLAPLVDNLPDDDPLWGWRMVHGDAGQEAGPLSPAEPPTTRDDPPTIPDWLDTPIGPEPRPPRPLAPSAAGEERGPAMPASATGSIDAARRGVLVHALLERLPEVPSSQRSEKGAAWLTRHADDLPSAARDEMLRSALGVLDDPRFADLFSPSALAEVPVAATVDGQVIAGNMDRLLIEDAHVTVVDYKTTRAPPADLASVPAGVLSQMGAYAAALAAIYPDRDVRAAVLYTHGPTLIDIPADVLAAHKPVVSGRQESFAVPSVE